MVILKLLLIIIFTAFTNKNVLCQNGFVFEKNDKYALQAFDLIETKDGDYIIVSNRFDYFNSKYKTSKLIKLSPSGELLLELNLATIDSSMIITDIHDLPERDGEYIAVGIYFDEVSSDIRYGYIVKFNENFEILERNIIQLPLKFEIMKSLLDSDNFVVIAGSYRDSISNKFNIGIVRLLMAQGMHDYNYYEIEGPQFFSDIVEIDESPLRYGIAVNGAGIPGQIAYLMQLDSNLQHIENTAIPYINGLSSGTVSNYTDSQLHFTGLYFPADSLIEIGGTVIAIDTNKTKNGDFGKSTLVRTNLNLEPSIHLLFGDGIMPDYPAPNRAISISDFGYIYAGGIKNLKGMQWPFQQEPSWIRVNKLDTELNIIWEKHFGGDAYYHVNCVTATSDGGVILSGFKTYPNQAPLMNLLVIKLKPDGTVSLDENPAEERSSDISIFPNPATTVTWLQLPENIVLEKARVELYSSSGRQLYKAQPTSYFHKIETADLFKGLYLVRLWDGEGWMVEKLVVR